jgi:hypothetical protein
MLFNFINHLNLKVMKTNLKLFGSTLLMCIAMIACEKDEINMRSEFDDLKKANNGMIKSYNNTMVLKWNQLLSKAIDQKMPQPAEAKIYVMYYLAVHDALNNVVPKYETYALDNSNVNFKDISKKNIYSIADAAVAQAAHDVFVMLVPAWTVKADSMLEANLADIEESEFKNRGIQTGKDAAAALFAKREGEAGFGFSLYPVGTLPGEYRPTLPNLNVYGATLDQLKPFGMISADQFRAVPPMDLNSPKYLTEFNEVKSLGSNSSVARTPEQTEIGLFCIDNVCNSMNRVTRFMAEQEKLDGWETARLMALTQMAVMDAYISSFEGKYHYNRWRPITAIQNGDSDGNDNTSGDPSWTILSAAGATPPTPTYPSTHAECGGAGTEILKQFFKTDKKSFTIGCYKLPDVTRSYKSFSEFSSELAVSRIYIGYHFRNDIEQGEKKGKELGKYVFENNLREL